MSANIHFLYQVDKEPDASFAKRLIRDLRQTEFDQADTVVSIGGDGLLLRALRRAVGKRVFGLVSPESNSAGFWTNKGIGNADDLAKALETSTAFPIKPIQADIRFADQTETRRYGYNEISIQAIPQALTPELKEEFDLSAIDVSVQSTLLNLSVHFKDATLGPQAIMGRGLVFSSALGSTAMNKRNGGPAENIGRETIILSGMGTKDIQPIGNDSDTSFSVKIGSPHKRPVIVSFDSFGVIKNEDESPIDEVEISTAHNMAADLMLTDHPGIRAYAELMR